MQTRHLLLLLLPALALAESAHRLPSLSPRQSTFTGGWALRKSSCPANTNTCPDIEGLPACCPKDTNCHTGYSIGREWVSCCPDNNEECDKLLKPLPVCADEKWVLWQGQKYKADVFCCEEGDVGYLSSDNSDNPACGPANLDIASSLTASTVKPAYQTKAGVGATKTSVTESTGSSSSEGGTSSESDTVVGNPTEDEIAASLIFGNKDSESKEKESLGSAAIAGIAIGAVAVVGLLALGFFWVHRMGQRKERASAPTVPEGQQYPYPQPYLAPQPTGTTDTGELDSKGLSTPGVEIVPELDARRQ